MLENNTYVIIGYSGHAYVVCDILLKNRVIIKGYCDHSRKEYNPYNLEYLGPEMAHSFINEEVFIAIGDNSIRKAVYESLPEDLVFMLRDYLNPKILQLVP